MDLQQLREAGLYDPAAPGADERRELLEYLLGEGCTVEEMQAAQATGRLFALAGDRRIRPLVGLLSLRQAAARLEVEPALLQRVWRAFGLPDQGADAGVLTDADVEALQTFLDVRAFLGADSALALVRVVGSSLARISEAEAAAMRMGMDSIDVARTGSEVVTARSYDAVTQLVPRVGQMLDALHRQHLEATRVRFEDMDVGERAAVRCGVGFADLSGFTQLARQLPLEQLSQVLSVFEDDATETVHEHGGRVVKFLGDAVMWVCAQPADLVAIGRALVRHPHAADADICVRAGLAFGAVLAQDGDYFGTTVNLAARLVAVARPGQVLLAGELVEGLPADQVQELEPVALRGFDGLVTPYHLVLGEGAQRHAPCED